MTSELKIGILGAANIAKKNGIAIQHAESNCRVVAIASRTLEKGTALSTFINQNGTANDDGKDGDNAEIIIYSGSDAYDKLISSDAVDALYIPLPTSLHKEWAIKALTAGKHVLLEKPVALNVNDYKEMLSIAKLNKCYLQDGTMFVHNPRTTRVLDDVSSSEFGQVTRINCDFTFLGNEDFWKNNIRLKHDCDSFGCIGDLGWYCVRFGLMVFHKCGYGRLISSQVTDFTLNEEKVPIDATCLCVFGPSDPSSESKNEQELYKHQKYVLSFHCSFIHPFRQRVEIIGSKKQLHMTDFVLHKADSNSFNVTALDNFRRSISNSVEISPNPTQQVMMWKFFSSACQGMRKTDVTEVTDEMNSMIQLSEQSQLIMDTLIESIKKDGSRIVVPS